MVFSLCSSRNFLIRSSYATSLGGDAHSDVLFWIFFLSSMLRHRARRLNRSRMLNLRCLLLNGLTLGSIRLIEYSNPSIIGGLSSSGYTQVSMLHKICARRYGSSLRRAAVSLDMSIFIILGSTSSSRSGLNFAHASCAACFFSDLVKAHNSAGYLSGLRSGLSSERCTL